MPSVYEEAWIEAKKLKDAAKQQAQTDLIEKYADEVKQNMNTLLERNEIDLGFGIDEADEEIGFAGPTEEEPDDEMDLGGDFDFEDDLEITSQNDSSYVDKQVPFGYAEGEKLCDCPEDEEEVEINFDDLIGAVDDESTMDSGETFGAEDFGDIMGDEEEGDESFLQEFELDESLFEELGDEDEEDPEDLEDEDGPDSDTFYQFMENNADQLDEELVSDTEEVPSGWSPRSDADFDDEFDKLLSRLQNPGKKDKESAHVNKSHSAAGDRRTKNDVNDRLKEDMRKVYKTNQKLASSLEKHKTARKALIEEKRNLALQASSYKEKLLETADLLQALSLDNTKLRLQNKVFENISLNERQKHALVEAISDAESPEEAKRIFKLQGTVVTERKHKGQNPLTEALRNKPTASAVLQNSRRARENETTEEQLHEATKARMKKLAGL